MMFVWFMLATFASDNLMEKTTKPSKRTSTRLFRYKDNIQERIYLKEAA
jgi:hypothetical protein